MIPAIHPPRRTERGMTLIEILVVVVIIAIMAAVATLSVGLLGGDREIEDETERLTNAIALLQEQAQLEGRDYGLRVEADKYEFMRFDGFEQRWKDVEGDPALLPHELPPGLVFELVLEGRPVLLHAETKSETKLPQLIAWGSGDMSPYRLSLARKDAGQVTLIGNADGTIEIERDAAK